MASLRLPHLDAPEPAISRFELGRYAAGELSPERRAEVERALAADPALAAALDAVVADQRAADAAFQLEVPLERFLTEHERRTRSSLSRLLALFKSGPGMAMIGAVVAAGALVVSITWTPADDGGELVENGIKGGARVGFFVRDGHAAHFGHDGEQLGAGDQIQFAVRDVGERRAMVLVGVDGRGAVTVYDAEEIDHERAKGESKPRLLPDSVVLDDSTGPERFFVVYGDAPVDDLRATVEGAARDLASSHGDLSSTERLPLPASFVQSSVHIVKVAR